MANNHSSDFPLLTRSADRGRTRLDWLDSRHSFSFGGHFDPERTGFGPLRVVNEDRVAPGGGFPPHPHRDMEIVSIVRSGQLEHKDSLGNGRVIETGDIQYMSAGTGVVHSEFNPSDSESAHFLQIWIEPRERGLPPRYAERKLLAGEPGSWRLLLSADGREGSMAIRQDADLRSAVLRAGAELVHRPKGDLSGQWLFVLKGSVSASRETLAVGDSLAWETPEAFAVKNAGDAEAEVLLFSVPLGKD